MVSDPTDGAPYPHRHESDGRVVPGIRTTRTTRTGAGVHNEKDVYKLI